MRADGGLASNASSGGLHWPWQGPMDCSLVEAQEGSNTYDWNVASATPQCTLQNFQSLVLVRRLKPGPNASQSSPSSWANRPERRSCVEEQELHKTFPPVRAALIVSTSMAQQPLRLELPVCRTASLSPRLKNVGQGVERACHERSKCVPNRSPRE